MRPSRIATLPVGYADGYDRKLSNNAEVLVGGVAAGRRPRVDGSCDDRRHGDIPEARFAMRCSSRDNISVEELATRAGTISYEVFCRITKRVPRIYK